MLNIEKMTINYVDVKTYGTVEIEVIIPNNVLDVNYFNYVCQFHAYNQALKVLESECIRVELEDILALDPIPATALALHDINVDKIHNAQNTWSDIVHKFMKNIGADLQIMFDNDKFARTYTALVTDFDTVYERQAGGSGKIKAKKVPSEFYKKAGIIRNDISRLENLVERIFTEETVSKAEKSEAFTPCVDKIIDAFGIKELNGAIYKNPSLKNIPVKSWTAFVMSLRKSGGKIANGSILAHNKVEQIYKSMLAIGLAKMGVVEIPDYSTPTTRSLVVLKATYVKKEDAKKESTTKENTKK